ncbi:ATP-dependent RNA helicase HrpA [Labedaea rhizosphaerae]|uniref:RNA helicase n=1 Tax=Labedaea rhizosphaerae TaxID=598644 RepID=A0A4R6SMA3_LABRH|nr:ATP-dependent RNA helicase HrpA [Labedaea rhizosphaerae]TDQ04452.1 ATP-dependent helicase HrpA [Labedaea rhizosphaerae]
MGTSTGTSERSPGADLRNRLSALMLRDERRLRRRLDGVRKIRDAAARAKVLGELAAEFDKAEQRVAARRASVQDIKYPADLPVSARKDDIAAAIRDNQVVIVAGETGSGKTTQLPKICLELGRGVRGTIGHTQPRRLAARTVAERIAEELGDELGGTIGYQVRFTDKASDDTMVKLMTDGILLAQIQHDRLLTRYDTLIIDEAHERSLNVDFLLGYLAQLLPKRPDLKVIITSATIDPERFSRHFGDAPIVEVSGRTYPVEVRYRPVIDPDDPDADEDRDQTQAIIDAVGELSKLPPGDILVFLSGEREIRDTEDALNALKLRDTEIVPLYARLSFAEQHKVFQPHRGRRVVLATNVAETSLTVPGIKYVIDPGTARISRYSNRLKVQRLPIEPVSQASANQRKGRCGRTSDGVCIRLYSEDDFNARPEFTDPEILRTNLASVILQMAAAGLGEMASFPFIDPPEARNIADGVNLLQELGALDQGKHDQRKLTDLGRKLAQLPVDPRIGRMVLAAADQGCVREVLVIAAALSIQDPRERPADHQQAADEAHKRFAEPDSDFLAFGNLWNHLRTQQRELSGNQFRKACRTQFLNYLRVREWQDVHGQLRQIVRNLDIAINEHDAAPDAVHRALLAGLLSHVGLKETADREYLGARNAKFAIFPGSGLARKPPRWVMAAELVETSRLWARVVARIDPDWIEPLAGHLVKRTYSEPHWERKRGAATALERVTLYGIPIVVGRKVNYGGIDPELSRELFIRHALVEGDWSTNHPFFRANRELLGEVEELEQRARRRDILVDEQTLFDFYDKRIGPEVVSARHFDTWWRKARKQDPHLLDYTPELLVNADAAQVNAQDYPDFQQRDALTLPLSYEFEPGRSDDGVTVEVPLAVLNQLDGDAFDWQVPGRREELVTALLRSLPKPLRRNFVPAPDFAKALLARIEWGAAPLLETLSDRLQAMTGIPVPLDSWDAERVPEHLKTTFRITDTDGKVVAEGKDLEALKQRLRPSQREALSTVVSGIERSGLTSWDLDALPQQVSREIGGHVATGYPALVDAGSSVDVRVLDTREAQSAAMWAGTRRLLLLGVSSPNKHVVRSLSNRAKLELSDNPHGSVSALLEDCVRAAADELIRRAGGPQWTREGFEKLREAVRAGLPGLTLDVLGQVQRVLNEHRAALAAADRVIETPLVRESLADSRAHMSSLVYDGFVASTGVVHLPDVVRYLQAERVRLDKLPSNPQRDQQWTRQVHLVDDEYRELLAEVPTDHEPSPALRDIRWMIEELRISYFAQTMRTAFPVSEKRIHRAMDAL